MYLLANVVVADRFPPRIVIVWVVDSRYAAAWVMPMFTVSAVPPELERVTRNSAWAIPGVASGYTAVMLTRGMVLLLVTFWSANAAASLPFASSITEPVPGFA